MFSKLLMSKVADGEEELNVTVSDVFGPEAYAHLKGEVLEEQWKRTNLTAMRSTRQQLHRGDAQLSQDVTVIAGNTQTGTRPHCSCYLCCQNQSDPGRLRILQSIIFIILLYNNDEYQNTSYPRYAIHVLYANRVTLIAVR